MAGSLALFLAAVRFDADEVRIAAHYSYESWETIVSLSLEMKVSKEGDRLVMILRSVHGGSLPVPDMVTRKLLEPLLREARSSRRHGSHPVEPLLEALRGAPRADTLFEGVHVRNRFVWPNGDRPFRVESISIIEGQMRLTVSPL